MKYCLSNRQTDEYLVKADEIKVEYRDKEIVPDLIEKYSDKTIILSIAQETVLDWSVLSSWNKVSENRLILCVNNINDGLLAKQHEIQFYLGYPVDTMFEALALVDLGVCYIRIGSPLFFNMKAVKSLGVPIRAVPNVAYVDGLIRKNGLYGQWIRPEDVETYEPYITVLEFEDCDIRKEQALYRIYAQDKRWPGQLNMIITNLGIEGLNRMIMPEVGQYRLNCQQACLYGKPCKICENAFILASKELIEDYTENKKS